jgi:hypothetical protein
MSKRVADVLRGAGVARYGYVGLHFGGDREGRFRHSVSLDPVERLGTAGWLRRRRDRP